MKKKYKPKQKDFDTAFDQGVISIDFREGMVTEGQLQSFRRQATPRRSRATQEKVMDLRAASCRGIIKYNPQHI